MDKLAAGSGVELDAATRADVSRGFQSVSITDELTLDTIRVYAESEPPYLLDPNGAVALAGALRLKADDRIPAVCMATAHPAKFPDVIARALKLEEGDPLPEAAVHPDLVRVPDGEANLSVCALDDLEHYLVDAIRAKESGTLPIPP